MEYHTGMQSESRPKQIVVGNTGTWYHYNIVEKQGEREETHETYTYYEYDGFWFPQQEFAGVQEGRLPNTARGWDDALWLIFRSHQHEKTNSGYFQAQRHIRDGSDEVKWNNYILELDNWNRAISALTMGDTNVPILPDPDTIN